MPTAILDLEEGPNLINYTPRLMSTQGVDGARIRRPWSTVNIHSTDALSPIGLTGPALPAWLPVLISGPSAAVTIDSIKT
jgi:hypothetical protein